MFGLDVAIDTDATLSGLSHCFPSTVLEFLAINDLRLLYVYSSLIFFFNDSVLRSKGTWDWGVLPYRTFLE